MFGETSGALCKKADIDGVWAPRELRHTFVSVMSESGVAVEEIARLAGRSRRGPEINSTPLVSPGTVASLLSLPGAHEIRVRPPRHFPR
jgi:hypothetical protein